MNKPADIDQLRHAADEAEREVQASMRARKDAVSRSQRAMAAASKARQRYLRALGTQSEADGNGDT